MNQNRRMEEFSLFEGDVLNRVFSWFGIQSRGFVPNLRRYLLILSITFTPTALYCLYAGFGPGNVRLMNFFGDLGALGQAFLGYPLFLYAESVINRKTRSAAHHFYRSGLVVDTDLELLDKLHGKVTVARRSVIPDIVCIIIAYSCSALWLWEETHNAHDSWHALGAPATQWPTLAGWWVALVGIPIFNYWWLRWVWKVGLWCWYLRRVSKLRLKFIASHPDLTGGLAFLSEAQTSFAIVIFAFGVGVIAPLIGYKIDIEGASIGSFGVGGPLIAFAIGAPLFFTLPLLFFTKQLDRVKRRAMDAYQDRATEAAQYFEETWLTKCQSENCDMFLSGHLSSMNNLNTAYNHIKQMRVVPFDLKSASQLFGSTFGSLLPLLHHFIEVPAPVLQALDVVKPFIGK